MGYFMAETFFSFYTICKMRVVGRIPSLFAHVNISTASLDIHNGIWVFFSELFYEPLFLESDFFRKLVMLKGSVALSKVLNMFFLL